MTDKAPFTPATTAQINYATRLGISISQDESLDSLCYKISLKLDPDHFVVADQSILEQAMYFGIHNPDSNLRDYVLRCIADSVLLANRTHDLCHWFLYRVFVHASSHYVKSPPRLNDSLFNLASTLQADSKFVSSVRREVKRCNLDRFGPPNTEYGVYPRIASVNTYAYKLAVEHINRLPIL